MSNLRPNMPLNPIQNQEFFNNDMIPNPQMNPPRMIPGGGPPQGIFHPHPLPPSESFPYPSFPPEGPFHQFDSALRPPTSDPYSLRRPNQTKSPSLISSQSSDQQMSKAKRFLFRLKAEIMPPRHPSATTAIPQSIECKNKQTIALLKLFSHIEILENKIKTDEISDDEEPKIKEPINNMKLLMEDDEMFEEKEEEQNQAQIEDDIAEQTSEDDESDLDPDKDNQFLKNDSILIVDQEERMALRQSKARKKRKHKRVEKVEVDPEWFEKLMKKN